MVHPLQGLFLTIVLAVQVPHKDSSARVTGQVTAKGEPVAGALVEATGSQIDAWTDRQGRFDLHGLPSGRNHLEVRALGFDPLDTTLSLRRGEQVVWNVILDERDWEVERERAESALVAAGGLDSVAAGLVSADTSTGFTYERFGIRLLRAAVGHSSPDSSCVLSPLSAGQALALALAAAKDSTAFFIAQALDLGGLGSEGIAARSQRFKDAVRVRRDITLKIANALWVDTSATLQPQFATWAQ